MYHIGLYTCNGLKYTSEVQRGAPLGGHHRWENNKRKRAPRALCRLYCWWVSTILSCVFTFIRECVCVCTRRTADDDESCCWRSFMRGLYTEWLIRQHWKYIRGGGDPTILADAIFLAFAVPWLMADVCDVNPPFLWLHGRQCATHHQQGRHRNKAAPGIRAARPSIHPATTTTS